VQTLLAPAPTTTVVPVAAGSAARAGAETALGSRLDRLRGDVRVPLGIGASAGVALLAGTGLAVRRRRRRPTTPPG
jgi:hypothetical protein